MTVTRTTRISGRVFSVAMASLLLTTCLLSAPLYGDLIQKANLDRYNGFIPFIGSGYGSSLGPFPSSLDLRNYNGGDYVTSVKNQGPLGTCWAFAVCGALESDLLMSGGPYSDFSENNMANRHGFDLAPNDGGDESVAIAYMSRLAGPGNETDDPYVGYDNRSTAPTTIPPQRFLQEVNYYTTPNAMKNAIMNMGALTTSLYWDWGSFRSSDNTFYYSANSVWNHSVDIVGWNDNKVTAGGTGAWLCKNSWGADWGSQGYFWLSYQDGSGGKYGASFKTESPNVAASMYTHAPHGEVGVVNTPLSCSVFHAAQVQALTSVGFYTQKDGAQYEIRVYDHWTGGGPSGLLESVSGTTTYQGYHVVDLPALVGMNSGDDFAIYLGIAGGGDYMQAIDYSYPGVSTDTANPGESFYSFDGSLWTDLQTFNTTASFAVNAYMTHISPGDANGDGKVDFVDFQILLDHWQGASGWANGDWTGDGKADFADFQVLLDNWNPSGYSGSAVPEPATLSLLVLGALAAMRRKR
jgi:C1A family cysteine protease